MDDLNIFILERDNCKAFKNYILPQVYKRLLKDDDLFSLGACNETNSLGALCVDIQGTCLKILSLYVDEKVRRRGIASLLLASMQYCCQEAGVPLEKAEIEYSGTEEEVLNLNAFLEAKGFEYFYEKAPFFSVESKDLQKNPMIEKAFSSTFKENSHIREFSSLKECQLLKIEEDERILPELKPSNMELSMFTHPSIAWVEEEEVLGFILVGKSFDGNVVMSSAYRSDKAPMECFYEMLLAVLNRCYMSLGRHFTIYISTINFYASKLLKKICSTGYTLYPHYLARTENMPAWLEGSENLYEN